MVKPLDPNSIPKYVNFLPIPFIFKPSIEFDERTGKVKSHKYTVNITEHIQQILPFGFPETKVFSYEGLVHFKYGGQRIVRSTPGPTFEALRNIPIHVQWVNNLTNPHFLPVDPTLHWANPNQFPPPSPPFIPFPPGYPQAQFPIPTVTHLHGGETSSDSDGHPEAWFTHNETKKGPAFSTSLYTYLNQQQPTTLWYHDHVLGITHLNVFAGLAGFYLLRDPNNEIEKILPKGKYEVPLLIQDRSFNEDGSLFFDSTGINPTINPYWRQNYNGNTNVVNGKVWPNLNVDRRLYRFRIVNGANSSFYTLKLSNNQSFQQIGSDGGFLRSPVTLKEVIVAPAERVDILVDFTALNPGTKILLLNEDKSADPDTTGQVMQFTVTDTQPIASPPLPFQLNDIPNLTPDVPDEPQLLNIIRTTDGTNNPLLFLLNGQTFDSAVSELPIVGSTVDWLVASTDGNHPIHIHLIQFLIISRQKFDADGYLAEWILRNGEPPIGDKPLIRVPVDPFLIDDPFPPDLNEQGWKDTVRVNSGEVARFRLRFAPQDIDPNQTAPGMNHFPFDPTAGPGYVWHCHILNHEDKDMMRPMIIRKKD
ncbi:multicopper oxidase domain-containing protein [Hazenella sp. IB182357]|uniref:Multicopper oxidase domain-containing protein n=1 Tax=Polycladospora coralii TaxID=2771432 RepID=A0A926NBT9_9BACL|nr:multicopper oxidase domain-containing protein [Polycladospora coralii]MBD1372910.1 multicopper oxidase domain-containing protein [Polycladospora coralii]